MLYFCSFLYILLTDKKNTLQIEIGICAYGLLVCTCKCYASKAVRCSFPYSICNASREKPKPEKKSEQKTKKKIYPIMENANNPKKLFKSTLSLSSKKILVFSICNSVLHAYAQNCIILSHLCSIDIQNAYEKVLSRGHFCL